MRHRRVRSAAAALGLALALAAPGAKPAEAQNLGDRIGGALNRAAQATGRAAQRAGSATGAAADRSLTWAQRKVRGEGGRRGAKPAEDAGRQPAARGR